MYDVIRRIVDDGVYFDMKPQWAKTIITCFARFGGRPVGIVANQPRQLGGILDNDSADKAARFVNLCNAFGIPLVFLQDVPGFMVGTKVEQAGIIRHGAKMLHAVANATVPKITVVLRKAYGAGYYVMCGRAYEPDLIVAWPTAEISVMGAEGAVEIVFRRQVEEAEDPVGQEGRADRGLPEDHRRLHRGQERHDRRRHRPPRDPADHLPSARDGREQDRRAALEASRSRAGLVTTLRRRRVSPRGRGTLGGCASAAQRQRRQPVATADAVDGFHHRATQPRQPRRDGEAVDVVVARIACRANGTSMTLPAAARCRASKAGSAR